MKWIVYAFPYRDASGNFLSIYVNAAAEEVAIELARPIFEEVIKRGWAGMGVPEYKAFRVELG